MPRADGCCGTCDARKTIKMRGLGGLNPNFDKQVSKNLILSAQLYISA